MRLRQELRCPSYVTVLFLNTNVLFTGWRSGQFPRRKQSSLDLRDLTDRIKTRSYAETVLVFRRP